MPVHTFTIWGSEKEQRGAVSLVVNYYKLKGVHGNFYEAFWQFLTKVNILLPYDPVMVFLGIHPKELNSLVQKKPFHRYS